MTEPRSQRPLMIALAVAVVVIVAGIAFYVLDPFSGEDSAALEAVTVSEGDEPTLEVPDPVEVSETVTRVVDEGDGRELQQGDHFRAGYLIADGADGELLDSSYASGGSGLVFELVPPTEAQQPQSMPGLPESMIEQLEGTPIGSTVLVATTAAEFFGDGATPDEFEPDQTLVFYFDIVDGTRVSATEAPSGTAVELPAGIPTPIVEGEDVTGVDGAGAAPTPTAAATVVIEGDGEQVEAGQAVVADYIGTIYPGGETFDSSFDREEPSVFSLSGVIPCWTDLLAGQTVGSRVVLTCPADVAYGDSPPQGGVIQPGDALTFVVDIRDAF